MGSVLLPWVTEIPWKCQSILLSGYRGPDDAAPPSIKVVNRWLRIISQYNADPSKDYMKQRPLPSPDAVCKELEWMTAHFIHHFADSLRIVAIWHPDSGVRGSAWAYHYLIAEELFHFIPEDDATFITRHRDKVAHE
ncbi:hypothetical protein LCGC14_2681270 [marine sediment metagenome]|uniref:Uncharacterized protein n=1 Tax=marine sediment metagenome TaxID=412755 RepID=A0A0F9A8T8_9ZZZZ